MGTDPKVTGGKMNDGEIGILAALLMLLIWALPRLREAMARGGMIVMPPPDAPTPPDAE